MRTIRLERHFDQRVLRCYADRPPSLDALWRDAAARRPQAEALVCGDQRLNWDQLQDRVLRSAAGLKALGVQPGDRVALLLGNGQTFVIASLAILACGAVIVPLSIRDQTPGLTHCLGNAGAVVLVHDEALTDRLPAAAALPALRHRLTVAEIDPAAGHSAEPGATLDAGQGAAQGAAHAVPARPFEQLAQHAPLTDRPAVHEEDVAIIMYTSGTTGAPKGAMLTHLNVVHSVLHYAQAWQLDHTVRAACVVPLSHVTGLVALMMVAVGLGGALLVVPQFKAGEFLALAAAERMNFTVMVPAMYKLCLLQDDLRAHDLAAWRVGGYGGAPMPPETIDQLAQELPTLALSNCYGATETTSPTTLMPPQLQRDHLDSVGLPLPCAEVAVMDDDGREVPFGEIGELWLKGPMVVKGYWANDAATQESFVSGYWRSGDIGCMDAQGFVQVLDRRKDMLNRGGYKIFSIEVENALLEHPDVLEAAVVAKPCPVLGERVHVFVCLREGAAVDAEVLRAHCRTRMSDYKVPETLTLGHAPLPRNANGKMLKRVMRETLLASLR